MPSVLVTQLALHRREVRLRVLSRGRHQRRLPNVHPPKAVALSYAHFLQDLLAEARAELDARLLPLLREITRTDAQPPVVSGLLHRSGGSGASQEITRLDARLPPKLHAAVQEAKAQLLEDLSPPRLEPAIRQVGGNVSRAQRKDILHQLSTGLGFNPVLAEPDLGPAMASWTAENVSLIRTLPGTYFADIEETVAAGIDAGDTASDIADDMVDRLGVAESRARLIARDQVGKFYGRLNQARQEANGITGYFWRTSEDNRVRDSHVDLDGTEQDWDAPPEGGGTQEDEEGHPGSGINCRCHADPDLGPILAGL